MSASPNQPFISATRPSVPPHLREFIDALDKAHEAIVSAVITKYGAAARGPVAFDVGVGADRNRAEHEKNNLKEHVEKAAEKGREGKPLEAAKEYSEALKELEKEMDD